MDLETCLTVSPASRLEVQTSFKTLKNPLPLSSGNGFKLSKTVLFIQSSVKSLDHFQQVSVGIGFAVIFLR